MTDASCACTTLHPCAARATQEDLLCDECRAWKTPQPDEPSGWSRIHFVGLALDASAAVHHTMCTTRPPRLRFQHDDAYDDT